MKARRNSLLERVTQRCGLILSLTMPCIAHAQFQKPTSATDLCTAMDGDWKYSSSIPTGPLSRLIPVSIRVKSKSDLSFDLSRIFPFWYSTAMFLLWNGDIINPMDIETNECLSAEYVRSGILLSARWLPSRRRTHMKTYKVTFSPDGMVMNWELDQELDPDGSDLEGCRTLHGLPPPPYFDCNNPSVLAFELRISHITLMRQK